MGYNSHHACLRSCEGLKANAWLFVCLGVSLFHLPSNVFTSTLHIRLGFPCPLTLKVTHCLYGQALNVVKSHLLICSHGGEWIASHDVVQNAFVSIAKDIRFHVSHEQTHVLPSPSLVFLSMCWHYLLNWWHLHFSGCGHHRSHPNRLGLLSCLISWVGTMVATMAKRLYHDRHLDKHISSTCHKGFWVLTPISKQLSSSMC
jgi:hypothetical protein